MGCSQRKRPDAAALPAIERYDGPAFRVLRRYFKGTPTTSVDVEILSAKYGLVSSTHPLPYYDHRLTKELAQQLNPQVMSQLKSVLQSNNYTTILVCLGQTYFDAIQGYEDNLPQNISVQVAEGGIGRKLSILHDWLYGTSSNLVRKPTIYGKPVRVKGIELTYTPEQVLDIAREAIASENPKAFRCHSWYVMVDEQQVSPKWLVSQLTGLPVSSFHSSRARQVLQQLGVSVYFDSYKNQKIVE